MLFIGQKTVVTVQCQFAESSEPPDEELRHYVLQTFDGEEHVDLHIAVELCGVFVFEDAIHTEVSFRSFNSFQFGEFLRGEYSVGCGLLGGTGFVTDFTDSVFAEEIAAV